MCQNTITTDSYKLIPINDIKNSLNNYVRPKTHHFRSIQAEKIEEKVVYHWRHFPSDSPKMPSLWRSIRSLPPGLVCRPVAYLPTLLHEWFGPQPTAGASQSEVGNPLSDVIVCRCREIYLLTFDECVLWLWWLWRRQLIHWMYYFSYFYRNGYLIWQSHEWKANFLNETHKSQDKEGKRCNVADQDYNNK